MVSIGRGGSGGGPSAAHPRPLDCRAGVGRRRAAGHRGSPAAVDPAGELPRARRGHLGQGRFASDALEEPSRLAAARDREQNPVRAGRAASPWADPGSSARAQVAGRDDSLVQAAPLLRRVGNWEDFLCLEPSEEEGKRLRRYERTGRPLGSESFTVAVERNLRRT